MQHCFHLAATVRSRRLWRLLFDLAGTHSLHDMEHTPLHIDDAERSIGRTLSLLRWTILAAMLTITLIWPVSGRRGDIWVFVLLLCAYNLIIEVLRHTVARLRSFSWVPLADLPIAGLFYYLDYEPGGPLFVFFYVALVSAAVTMSLRNTVLYTLAVLAAIAVVAPTLPGWSPDGVELRQLTSRLIVLSLVGIGTAVLTRRLVAEQARARQMRLEAERLEELDHLRNEFIASVSHDLRTPITAVRAGLGMLEMHTDVRSNPSERTLLANVRRNVERLNQLIDELLTLNQLQAGVLKLDLEPLDLRAVVNDAVGAVAPLLREAGQTLELDVPAPLRLEADRRRLEQVLVNLLANAQQHTPRGTRIVVSGRAHENEVELAISDNGPGIPAAELEAIFERFHRLSSRPGSGLGLAIVRSIVELHGGRIWAVSAGSGATFRLCLPRRVQPHPVATGDV